MIEMRANDDELPAEERIATGQQRDDILRCQRQRCRATPCERMGDKRLPKIRFDRAEAERREAPCDVCSRGVIAWCARTASFQRITREVRDVGMKGAGIRAVDACWCDGALTRCVRPRNRASLLS